jgi:hypothetical protein
MELSDQEKARIQAERDGMLSPSNAMPLTIGVLAVLGLLAWSGVHWAWSSAEDRRMARDKEEAALIAAKVAKDEQSARDLAAYVAKEKENSPSKKRPSGLGNETYAQVPPQTRTVGSLTYTCAQAGVVAARVYDAKQEGHSLRTVLSTISNASGGSAERQTMTQGIAIAIYGDSGIQSSAQAYAIAHSVCQGSR